MFSGTWRRAVAASCAVAALALGAAAPALAFHCGNASKPVGPGEQAVLDTDGNPVSIGPAYRNQLNHGKDPETLHGGFVGFDCDGDGVADVDTYANPHGVVPETAQVNGSPNHGVVEIESTAPASCDFGE
jgi:hypothetical protein